MSHIYACPNCQAPTVGLQVRFRLGRMTCSACGAVLRWSRGFKAAVAIVEPILLLGAMYLVLSTASLPPLAAILALGVLGALLVWVLCAALAATCARW